MHALFCYVLFHCFPFHYKRWTALKLTKGCAHGLIEVKKTKSYGNSHN